MGLPARQVSIDFGRTPRRLADKPAPSLHTPGHRKSPAEAGLSWVCRSLFAGGQQARHLNVSRARWLMVAPETTAAASEISGARA